MKTGIHISLDDFGTGFSSLSYINEYPISNLKIDRYFVANIENNIKERNLITSIIDMSRNLNLNVIAEGVESESQLKLLVERGCDLFQGFYFGKPQSKEKFLTKKTHWKEP